MRIKGHHCSVSIKNSTVEFKIDLIIYGNQYSYEVSIENYYT